MPQEVTNRIDWSMLRGEPTEQIDAELAKRYNDLLFRMNLTDDPKAGIVLPVVLFQGRGKRMSPRRHPVRYSELLDADLPTLDAFRRYIPDFEFALDDLTLQSRDALHARQLTAVAWVALTLLREASSNPELLQQLRNPKDLAPWRLASETPNAAVVLQQFWVYLYRIVDFPVGELQEFARVVSELAEQTHMNTAQRMIDQGRKEGLKEGEAKGKAATLKQLVQLKFGQVDELVLSRITDASSQQLDLWTQRFLFAASLDELFRP